MSKKEQFRPVGLVKNAGCAVRNAVAPMGKYHNVPELPPHFLPRLEDISALKQHILNGVCKPVGITGVASKVGVYGMADVSKSVLAEMDVAPGRPWLEALEEVIQATKSAAVLVGADCLGSWEIPEMHACLSEFVSRQLTVIPVLLPDASWQK